MKLSGHKINMLNYTLILIVIWNNTYFNEFFAHWTSYRHFSTWEDIETQCAQGSSYSCTLGSVKNMMCACYSCALPTVVEFLRIRFQNSSAKICESNKGVFLPTLWQHHSSKCPNSCTLSLIHYFYNSKTRCESQNKITDSYSIATPKNMYLKNIKYPFFNAYKINKKYQNKNFLFNY